MDNVTEAKLGAKQRKYFTIVQVAELFQVSERTIKQLVQSKNI